MVRNHEEQEHEQHPHSPRRAPRPVDGVLLRKRQEEPARLLQSRQKVDGEEQQQRGHHEDELQVVEEALEDGLVVGVPGHAHEREEDREEETEVEGDRWGLVVAVIRHFWWVSFVIWWRSKTNEYTR